MESIINTIVPVFLVILLGHALRRLGFLPGSLTAPLNRLVYYVAIPAMIFDSIAGASFELHFRLSVLLGTLGPVLAVFCAAGAVGGILGFPRQERGTFVQNAAHGNLGYIGFAVSFYFLGEDGLTRATIIAGFLILMQNLLSVIALQAFSPRRHDQRPGLKGLAAGVVGNPVVLSSMAGIAFNLSGLSLPRILGRALEIISGMALPLALLVIGAGLSFELIRTHLRFVVPSAALKLFVLPGLGLLTYWLLGLDNSDFLPGLILLAAPTATVSYVMAAELGGSESQAGAAVSMSTLLSSLTYTLWLVFVA
ncbi:MAG: AEC family transporter [Desulfobacteraceae bacterium]